MAHNNTLDKAHRLDSAYEAPLGKFCPEVLVRGCLLIFAGVNAKNRRQIRRIDGSTLSLWRFRSRRQRCRSRVEGGRGRGVPLPSQLGKLLQPGPGQSPVRNRFWYHFSLNCHANENLTLTQ